jgi:hypothetical protein
MCEAPQRSEHVDMPKVITPSRPILNRLFPVRPTVDVVTSRVLLAGATVSGAMLVAALIGLIVDHQLITGAPAWLKPAKFGISISIYLLTLRWMIGFITGRRRLVLAISAIAVVSLMVELLLIGMQVLRGTSSHFNESTAFDAAVYFTMGGFVVFVFVATVIVAVLILRTRAIDAGTMAGIRWGLASALLGMALAGLMIANQSSSSTGGHTVGGPDGGGGMPITDWSLDHGDLRICHFVGLHGLQILPLVAWALWRFTPLLAARRARVLRVLGVAYLLFDLLVAWQAERGQPMLRPDSLTLEALAVLIGLTGCGVALVLSRTADTHREQVS